MSANETRIVPVVDFVPMGTADDEVRGLVFCYLTVWLHAPERRRMKSERNEAARQAVAERCTLDKDESERIAWQVQLIASEAMAAGVQEADMEGLEWMRVVRGLSAYKKLLREMGDLMDARKEYRSQCCDDAIARMGKRRDQVLDQCLSELTTARFRYEEEMSRVWRSVAHRIAKSELGYRFDAQRDAIQDLLEAWSSEYFHTDPEFTRASVAKMVGDGLASLKEGDPLFVRATRDYGTTWAVGIPCRKTNYSGYEVQTEEEFIKWKEAKDNA